jgi:putative ABC transport system permease protein
VSEPRPAPRTFWNIGWRYLLRHRWQSALMLLGIMLGVAVVVSIDLANESASRAFDLSVESVAGRATHQITGGPAGLDEAVYTRLRREGIGREIPIAPIVTDTVYSPQLGDQPLRLLGVDPLAEPPFRSYLTGEGALPLDEIAAFLTEPGAVLISADLAERYGVAAGDHLTLEVGGRTREAVVVGLLLPEDNLSRRSLNGLILADVATAQEMLDRVGVLDRIDVLLPDAAGADRLRNLLPEETRLEPVTARTGTVEEMTAAFRTNLLALSMLALVVGMFLIYNTMTFSVVQRRTLFGTLRALGVTRREVFLLVVAEALVVGVVGSGLGLGLGVVLGQGAVRLVTRTVNDLFYTVSVQGVAVPPISLAKGAALGVLTTVAAAALPAWEAASVPPRAALTRSHVEVKASRRAGWLAGGGLAVLLAGVGLLLVPTRGLGISFAGTFAVIVGAAMLTPLAMKGLLWIAQPATSSIWGALGRMAPRGVANALSRTSIAVAALMVAVSVTIGISLMVGSFRHTVVIWLEHTLQGDIYISVPGGPQNHPTSTVDDAVLDVLTGWPGVRRVDSVRSVDIASPDGPQHVVAVRNPDSGSARRYLAADGSAEEVWQQVQAGAVTVSEPYARRQGIPLHGGEVTLNTPEGPRVFPVVGVYYDYGSTDGQIMMSQDVYRSIWDDDAITAVALRLEEGVDADAVADEVQRALAPIQRLRVRPNRALREDVLVVFDQTFAITGALNVLATVVAFVGVLSALLSLQLEKQREYGILRAVGMTVRQLWGLTMLETGLMGAIAGLLSMPTGFALSLILVYIINRRAFGWTLQMQVMPRPFGLAFAVALIAALLAGLYPAWRISRMAAADAIRYE